jgi:predicted lipoprotein
VTFADGTVWHASDIVAIAEGEAEAFGMSAREVAEAFWKSLPYAQAEALSYAETEALSYAETEALSYAETEAVSDTDNNQPAPPSGGSGGCDSGAAGVFAVVSAAVISGKVKKRGQTSASSE